MSMKTPNYALVTGYLEGTIRGQVESIQTIRDNKLMSDKELLNHVLERLKLALDTVKTFGE